jgi:hypothetical protein
MAIEMAVFAFGSLLMLVAILGGGFEVKELKVPKVGPASRIAACACGMLFIFLGIYLNRPAAAAPAAAAAAPQAPKSTEAVSAAVPQIVLVTALAGQPALRVDKLAGPTEPSAPAASQPGAGAAQGRREAQETAAPAAPQQVGSGNAKQAPHVQTAAPSRTATKRVPWEQKPRQWISRIRGKEAAR